MKLSKSQAGFLVVLRLVCGSHFFYQGMIKLADRSWSSYSYLMNSEWVLGGAFRWMAETKAVLAVVDIVNVWGLILIGLALILGVFGRIASLCGFLLLSLYYLANPPFAVMGASPVGGYGLRVRENKRACFSQESGWRGDGFRQEAQPARDTQYFRRVAGAWGIYISICKRIAKEIGRYIRGYDPGAA